MDAEADGVALRREKAVVNPALMAITSRRHGHRACRAMDSILLRQNCRGSGMGAWMVGGARRRGGLQVLARGSLLES